MQQGRMVPWVLVVALAVGCAPTANERPDNLSQRDPKTPRVLIVGMDGLEWNLVLRLLREERMPNLAGLMERGVFGLLESLKPTASPVIWTSMATGQVADKHGILGFVDRESKQQDGEHRLYTNGDRRTKALWNITTDHGLRSAIVGWWVTYPVEAIDGVMVAQTNVVDDRDEIRYGDKIWKGTLHAEMVDQVWPADRQEAILAHVPQVERDLDQLARSIFGEFESTGELADRLWAKSRWSIRADEIYRRIGKELLDEGSFDLFAVYFGGPDVLGHRYWRYMQPALYLTKPTTRQIELLGEHILKYYVHMDRVLGELLEAAGEDVTVLVVSDHGMVPVNTRGRFPEDGAMGLVRSGGHNDAEPGVLVAAGPGIGRTVLEEPLISIGRNDLTVVGSVLDLAPTVLALLDLPLGRDMDGKVMQTVLEAEHLERFPLRWVDSHTPVDWMVQRQIGTGQHDGDAERLEQLRSLGYLGD